MWKKQNVSNPFSCSDIQFGERIVQNQHESGELPTTVDSACIASHVKLKNVDPSFEGESFQYMSNKSTPFTQNALDPISCPTLDLEISHRSPASFVYKTRAPRRGTCLIISIDTFKPILCLPSRPGAEVDLHKLQDAFHRLDFDVKYYQNLTAADILNIVDQESKMNHFDADCFACVILTHGDDGGLIYGTDGAVHLDQIIHPFRGNTCPGLAGKPKMFFIQACRGTRLDVGTLVSTDGFSNTGEGGTMSCLQRIPVEADFLVAYAVQPGYYAFRNSVRGSWFIQALTDCLSKYSRTLDLMSIMTRVNYEVAYEFESLASDPEYSGKKQVPSIVCTLTKDIFFTPKMPILHC